MNFSFIEIFAAFMVLFAVIDIPGSIPLILDIQEKTGAIQPWKAALVAFGIMYSFLFIGKPLLNVFGVILLAIAVKRFISNTRIESGNAR
jgi:multiple antibiotic resistance protein